MIWAALRLYQATARETYLTAARQWVEVLDRHYWHAGSGGYTMSADDTRDVIVRLRSAGDDATPNANAIMISNLVGLSVLTGEERFAGRAHSLLHAFSGEWTSNLIGHVGLLAGAMDLIAPQLVVILDGPLSTSPGLQAVLYGASVPGALEFALVGDNAQISAPAIAGKTRIDAKTTAYICSGPQCSAPIREPEALRKALKEKRMAL
jgi:hypothetical protein